MEGGLDDVFMLVIVGWDESWVIPGVFDSAEI
jgi:hypothetical protein